MFIQCVKIDGKLLTLVALISEKFKQVIILWYDKLSSAKKPSMNHTYLRGTNKWFQYDIEPSVVFKEWNFSEK